MANINSQKKRIRQDSKRNVRNKSLKSELKTTLKILESLFIFINRFICYTLSIIKVY